MYKKWKLSKEFKGSVDVDLAIDVEKKVRSFSQEIFNEVSESVKKQKDLLIMDIEIGANEMILKTDKAITRLLRDHKNIVYDTTISIDKPQYYIYKIRVKPDIIENKAESTKKSVLSTLQKRLRKYEPSIYISGLSKFIVNIKKNKNSENIIKVLDHPGNFSLHLIPINEEDLNKKRKTIYMNNDQSLEIIKKPIVTRDRMVNLRFFPQENQFFIVLEIDSMGINTIRNHIDKNANYVIVLLSDNKVLGYSMASKNIYSNNLFINTTLQEDERTSTLENFNAGAFETDVTLLSSKVINSKFSISFLYNLLLVTIMTFFILMVVLTLLFHTSGFLIVLSAIFNLLVHIVLLKFFSISIGMGTILGAILIAMVTLLNSFLIMRSIWNRNKEFQDIFVSSLESYESNKSIIFLSYTTLFMISMGIYIFTILYGPKILLNFSVQNFASSVLLSLPSSLFSVTFFRHSIYMNSLLNQKKSFSL